MDDVDAKASPEWMVETLERSEAQIATGQTVPLGPLLARLWARVGQITAKTAEAPLTQKA